MSYAIDVEAILDDFSDKAAGGENGGIGLFYHDMPIMWIADKFNEKFTNSFNGIIKNRVVIEEFLTFINQKTVMRFAEIAVESSCSSINAYSYFLGMCEGVLYEKGIKK